MRADPRGFDADTGVLRDQLEQAGIAVVEGLLLRQEALDSLS